MPFAYFCKINKAQAAAKSNLYVFIPDIKNRGLDTPCIKAAFFIGGDGGNRNRVRKFIPATFYERSRSIRFPANKPADRQNPQVALWFVKSYRALTLSCALLNDIPCRAAVFPGERLPQLSSKKYFLIFVVYFEINCGCFKRYHTAARLSRFKIPVEILSSPWGDYYITLLRRIQGRKR